ncbi:helix-turn-helix domain-containing protein [Streptomyces sp. 3N207]|uniref:helix-turn-helix domain-containing protein n=1 Tax=Streptomyces sp. 3N207 TaxID=3457417 RepID=UPI003FD1C2A9
MNWSTQAIREAARQGNYGRVIRLARTEAGVSQEQLAEAIGASQSAISRLELRERHDEMVLLARAATYLGAPPRLVGLADDVASRDAPPNGTEVERRKLLAGAAAAAAAPAVSALDPPAAQAADTGHAATLRLATTSYRRMDGTTSSRALVEPVQAHLRLTQSTTAETRDKEQRARLAAVSSEVASLAGWLAWDMGDHGSARTWYGTAVKAARSSGNRLLISYQLGSLAQFEAHIGNAVQGLEHVRSARRQLGGEGPAIANAWLSTTEALAHSAAADARSADRALVDAARTVSSMSQEAPPWPWVFNFSHSKVAACRLACGARLGRPEWVFSAQDDASAALSSGHEKQRALYVLDVAAALLAQGRLDGAFALALSALEAGMRYKSGRILEKARELRRGYVSAVPPKVVREFDDRLYSAYL